MLSREQGESIRLVAEVVCDKQKKKKERVVAVAYLFTLR